MPNLPFTREQFFGVFTQYNEAVWPAQVVAVVGGLAMVVLVLRPSRRGDRFIGAGLAAMWGWTGIAYHALHFSAINQAAYAFAVLFVAQAILLLHVVVVRARVAFRPGAEPVHWLGWALVAYALVLYPLVGLWFGHTVAQLPMFGITPCPLTLFTLRLLLMAAPPARGLLVIPLLWSAIGGSAATLLGVPQDWPLLLGGVVVAGLLAWQWGHRRPVAAS